VQRGEINCNFWRRLQMSQAASTAPGERWQRFDCGDFFGVIQRYPALSSVSGRYPAILTTWPEVGSTDGVFPPAWGRPMVRLGTWGLETQRREGRGEGPGGGKGSRRGAALGGVMSGIIFSLEFTRDRS